MTLLVTVFAAVISTSSWYFDLNDTKKLGKLALMYWGASLMGLVDAVAEYLRIGADYFTPAVKDMINDAFLGFSVVAVGLVIWLVSVLISDPNGKIKARLSQ